MSVLVLPRSLRGEIEADASGRYPEEACGVLVGDRDRQDAGRSRVRALRVEENVHSGNRGRRFAIDPKRLLAIQKELRERGQEVIGYYHSHPDAPAAPSASDLEAAWPETSYLILAVSGGSVVELRSWRLAPGSRAFEEEEIEYPSA